MKDKVYRAFRYIFKGIPNTVINKNIVEIEKTDSLDGKRILITGGNRGIGFEIASKSIKHGAEVYIVGRSESKLIEAKRSLGERCHIFVYDMSSVNDIQNILEFIERETIDVLVNNAGISLHEKSSFDVTVEGFEEQFGINLKTPYFLSIGFAEVCIRNKREGSIINIVSERGLYCDDLPYGLTKSALISFTRGFARRVIKKGIRVNAIAPGVTATEMTGYREDENLFNEYICSNRTFLASEVAEVAVFLISDISSCISGDVIACNSGNHLRCDW